MQGKVKMKTVLNSLFVFFLYCYPVEVFNGSYDSSQKKLLTFRKPYFSKGKHLTKKIMKTFYVIFTAEIIFLHLANKCQKLK